MVICFDCPEDAKRALDELIASGQYRNYAEIISLAIANQLLLHSHVGSASGILIKPASGEDREGAVPTGVPTRRSNVTAARASAADAFRPANAGAKKPHFAPLPDDTFVNADIVPVDRWIFGQFNRLLPAKASCRALANRLAENADGLDLHLVSIEIARAARVLGIELQRRDAEQKTDRDDQLGTAFPMSEGAEKGIARYANQFVGNMNPRGQLSGLLASLKLIGRVEGKRKGFISLTEPGWYFGVLPNPCIDDHSATKFSEDERDFLCDHILKHVPKEASAYLMVLELAIAGHDTPAKLDKALAKTVSKSFKASESFIATQRSGAISRMTDLGLMGRERQATRVRYVVTEAGASFLTGGAGER